MQAPDLTTRLWYMPIEWIPVSFFDLIFTWPKNFVFEQVLFSSACMCLSVSVYIDYLKKFLTYFDEIWQNDGEW